jgi:membrane protease YdiL (CAAX protease family)
MTLFDDNPLNPPDENLPAQPASEWTAEFASPEPLTPPLAGDPISYAAVTPAARADSSLPEDLRISWSWLHLLVFVMFGVASQLAIGVVLIGYLSADRHLSQKQLKQLFESDPRLIVGTNVLWFALIFLFLYVTLSVLRGLPFWQTLGWKRLNADPVAGKGSPWTYFFSGCGLAIFVAIASSRIKNVDHVPIQELFKSRSGAMLLMAMAVFVAPLVEETIFRGYLYPLFAKSLGVLPGILITGVLFGLMHGAQLGWSWGLVALLTLVGVIFTFVRARTGTVVASFLLHLGYNSMIAFTSIIATKGFTQMPPHS